MNWGFRGEEKEVLTIKSPFRVEHIGSLLRPRSLKDAWKQVKTGEISETEYGSILDNAISDVIRLQENTGLKAITDGEFRRKSYWSHFLESVDGLEVKESDFRFRDVSGRERGFLAPHMNGHLRWTESVAGKEFGFLNAVTTGTPKLTMPSPSTMHFWRGPNTFERRFYQDEELYFVDLEKFFKAEIQDLVARGCTYLQLDEVALAMLCDEKVCNMVTERGTDPYQLAERYAQLINNSILGLPEEVRVGLHLCRGNLKGSWLSEGGYEGIASLIFNKIEVDTFFLEYDDFRSGGFGPLRYITQDKVVVLGLMTTKSPNLEKVDDLKRRVEQASRYVSMDNLGISPQCGFSSTVSGNPLTMDDQWRKLELLVKAGEEIWGGI